MRLLDVIFLLIFIYPVAQTEVECDPPVPPEHGTVHIFENNFNVGNIVEYTCDEGRILVGSASSRCLETGEWTFPPPRCLMPCLVPKVEHGKIGRYVVNDSRRKFEELPESSESEDNEELYLRCEPNYEPFGKPGVENKVVCSNGKWEVVPICKSGHCHVKDLKFPGLITGNKSVYKTDEVYNVSCEHGFTISKVNNQIKCVDGVWQGHLRPCITVSCNAKHISVSENNIFGEEKTVLDGEHLNVRCREGYSPSGQQARCSRGQWNVTGKLCQESKCTIHKIDNGSFNDRILNREGEFPLFQYRYEYKRLLLGGKRRPGSLVFVSCDGSYTFQGKPQRIFSVMCSKGKWHPDPVCLFPSCNAEDLVESEGIVHGDEKMVWDGEYLDVRCREGYSPSGQQALCSSGQWNVTGKLCEQTSCNAEDLFESDFIVPDDEKMILDGEHLNVRCREGYSPSGQQALCSSGQWIVTGKLCEESSCTIHRISNGVLSERVQKKVGSFLTRYTYRNEYQKLALGGARNPGSSVFLICDRRYSFQGKQRHVLVTCSKGKWDPDPVCLLRLSSVKCPKFDERDFVIYYDKEQAVNSTAVFSCKDPRKRIHGTHSVTCLSSGQWSSVPPECKTGCPILTETEDMSIFYTKGLVEGSIASFDCIAPLISYGVSRTTCLPNGKWANPPAQCVLSTCSLDQLYNVLPFNVVPVMENITSDIMPYNYSLTLICDYSMKFIGLKTARCGEDGAWETSKTECSPGCGFPNTGNSEMIIEPAKDFYRFGESVSLSCRSGYVLNSDVVRLVCLGFTWSKTNMPECVRNDMEKK